MNSRQPRHVAPGVNRLLRYFTMLVVAALAPRFLLAITRQQRSSEGSQGYLVAVGSPALRFQKPVQMAPRAPKPLSPTAAASTPSAPPKENSAAFSGVAVAPLSPPVPDETAAPETKPENPSGKTKTSPNILPDDTRHPTHPEDFLPFFQFPGAGPQSGVNVIVPVPHGAQDSNSTPLPVSSATYTQTPK